MGNKNTGIDKISFYIGLIGGLCSIFGVSVISIAVVICSYLNDLTVTSFLISFIIKYGIYISLLGCALCFFLNHLIIPKYKIHKRNIPEEEAKPSYLLSGLLIIIVGVNLMCIFIPLQSNYAQGSTTTEEPQTLPHSPIDEGGDNNPIEPDTDPSNDIITLTPLEQTVDMLVPLTYEEVLPIETWRELSDKELYYCRNGIFAYAHAIFESDFYEVFSWYSGTVNIKDFDWGVLNPYQIKNIENIKAVEKERGLYK